ncbi:MAG: TetR/AcrR family transcriptional regulator [Burkholderiaceae bacterium]
MARPRAQNHDENKALIRDRAAAAFARLGYASASMADLAQACDISKAALYHYYDSKEAILFEALDTYTSRLSQLTRSFTDDDEGKDLTVNQARDRLSSLINALLAEYAYAHNFHVNLLTDVKFLGVEQREQITEREREVVRRIGQLIDQAFPGRIEPHLRSVTTMALLGMINFTFAWWDPEGPIDHQQLAQVMIDLWWQGLAPRA